MAETSPTIQDAADLLQVKFPLGEHTYSGVPYWMWSPQGRTDEEARRNGETVIRATWDHFVDEVDEHRVDLLRGLSEALDRRHAHLLRLIAEYHSRLRYHQLAREVVEQDVGWRQDIGSILPLTPELERRGWYQPDVTDEPTRVVLNPPWTEEHGHAGFIMAHGGWFTGHQAPEVDDAALWRDEAVYGGYEFATDASRGYAIAAIQGRMNVILEEDEPYRAAFDAVNLRRSILSEVLFQHEVWGSVKGWAELSGEEQEALKTESSPSKPSQATVQDAKRACELMWADGQLLASGAGALNAALQGDDDTKDYVTIIDRHVVLPKPGRGRPIPNTERLAAYVVMVRQHDPDFDEWHSRHAPKRTSSPESS